MSRRSALLSLVIISLLASGCGGGGGDTTSGGINRAKLIRRGDQICEETERRQEDGLRVYAIKHNLEDLSEEQAAKKIVVAVGLPAVRRQVKELRALGVPSGEEDVVEEILAETEKAIERAEEEPSSMLALSTNPFRKVEVLARSYGFEVCGGA